MTEATQPIVGARALFEQGRFKEALAQLGTPTDVGGQGALILRAELLERIGKHAQSESLLRKLARMKSLTSQEKGATEYILGRIAIENARVDDAWRLSTCAAKPWSAAHHHAVPAQSAAASAATPICPASCA